MFINFLIILGAYGIGSIPTGFLLARLLGIRDIRSHGSGNIGATNIARVLGKKYFFIILLLDAGKAFIYLKFLQHSSVDQVLLYYAAIALLFGNVFSIFLHGQGGKGVATAIGSMCALQPVIVLYVFFVWFTIFVLTKTVGIASVSAAIILPFVTWWYAPDNYALILFSIVCSVIITWRHQENIKKYLQ
ncbi:MAG TPA: glycerol-3-phosphate 1-O-acyltransferase PlsY [Candidatus Dependentiae bacterium]|nr:glycerol-3-phosphate 1-O-acyltransferase PlsY [Candidatus Dependentiae bacterium]HRQ62352.1 glycerol-3-phosphate 1-O-acyltransferase PlsY [Candidatus Dependentiae bacterium]